MSKRPCWGSKERKSRLRTVVLPAPDDPTMATSPSGHVEIELAQGWPLAAVVAERYPSKRMVSASRPGARVRWLNHLWLSSGSAKMPCAAETPFRPWW
jgi:hypothetical protein